MAHPIKTQTDSMPGIVSSASPVGDVDDEDAIMAAFGFSTDSGAPLDPPPTKKRKVLNKEKPPEAAEENPDAAAQVYTHESLGFDPKKRCRLPKCKLMKKVGQPTCGPHRKQKEESSCNSSGMMCFKCERITALIT